MQSCPPWWYLAAREQLKVASCVCECCTWAKLIPWVQTRSIRSTRPSPLLAASQHWPTNSQERPSTCPRSTWLKSQTILNVLQMVQKGFFFPFTSDTSTCVRYQSGEGPELSCQMWTPQTGPRLFASLLGARTQRSEYELMKWWHIMEIYCFYTVQPQQKSLIVKTEEFYLSMKESLEFLLNRVHPGTCNSFVCETPSSPCSSMYTW